MERLLVGTCELLWEPHRALDSSMFNVAQFPLSNGWRAKVQISKVVLKQPHILGIKHRISYGNYLVPHLYSIFAFSNHIPKQYKSLQIWLKTNKIDANSIHINYSIWGYILFSSFPVLSLLDISQKHSQSPYALLMGTQRSPCAKQHQLLRTLTLGLSFDAAGPILGIHSKQLERASEVAQW